MKFSNLGMGRTQIENMQAMVEYTFHACLEGKLLTLQRGVTGTARIQ